MAELAFIAEDNGHALVVDWVIRQTLRSHAAHEGADWILGNLEHLLVWLGSRDLSPECPNVRYTPVVGAVNAGKDLGQAVQVGGIRIKTRGHFDGEPASPEAAHWRRVILAALLEHPDGLVLAKDTDGRRGALKGIGQAVAFVQKRDPELVLVVAAPHPEVEAWLVGGYRAESEEERLRITELAREMSFDPTKRPDRLTAHPNDTRTDAKRTLRVLALGEDRSAVLTVPQLAECCARCLSADSEVSQGKAIGLDALVEQAIGRIYPVLGV